MRALVLIDVINAFFEALRGYQGGSLPVPGGHEIIPVVNKLLLSDDFQIKVSADDAHPAEHVSFFENHPGRKRGEIVMVDGLEQMLWPRHGVRGEFEANYHPQLLADRIQRRFFKGEDPRLDSYSGFYDNARRKSTGLHEYLQLHNVTEIVVVGLAFDYCVGSTALDGVFLGYKVSVIESATRAVDLPPGNRLVMRQKLLDAGVALLPEWSLAS